MEARVTLARRARAVTATQASPAADASCASRTTTARPVPSAPHAILPGQPTVSVMAVVLQAGQDSVSARVDSLAPCVTSVSLASTVHPAPSVLHAARLVVHVMAAALRGAQGSASAGKDGTVRSVISAQAGTGERHAMRALPATLQAASAMMASAAVASVCAPATLLDLPARHAMGTMQARTVTSASQLSGVPPALRARRATPPVALAATVSPAVVSACAQGRSLDQPVARARQAPMGHSARLAPHAGRMAGVMTASLVLANASAPAAGLVLTATLPHPLPHLRPPRPTSHLQPRHPQEQWTQRQQAASRQ